MGRFEKKPLISDRKETLCTDKGIEVDVLYYDDVVVSDDGSYRNDIVEAQIDGYRAGYLRVNYITKDSWEASCPTILHFLASEISDKIYVGLQELIANSGGPESWSRDDYAKALEILNRGAYSKKESYEHESLDELLDIWAQKEIELEDQYRDIYNQKHDWLVNRPKVDYVEVYGGGFGPVNKTPGLEDQKGNPDGFDRYGNIAYTNYRGQGIGTLLYEAAAKHLEGRGLNLYRGSRPSEAACKVWEKLQEKYGLESEDAIDISWNTVSRLSLDGSKVELERVDVQNKQPKLNDKAPILPESSGDSSLLRDSSSSIARD